MSVLVKDMEMPTDCFSCHLKEEGFCNLTNELADDIYKRNNDCPLVELPKKHGDLIDMNDLKKEYGMGFDCNNCVSNLKPCEYNAIYAKMDFCLMLDDAPVVIEAEGEG